MHMTGPKIYGAVGDLSKILAKKFFGKFGGLKKSFGIFHM